MTPPLRGVSPRAAAELHRLMERSMLAALKAPADAVAAFGERKAESAALDDRAVVLSIAGTSFRMMLFLDFGPLAVDAEAMDEAAERGNLCCGTINREISRAFAQVGMSTPHFVETRSIDHLAMLRPDYLVHFRLALNDGRTQNATLCVCAQGAFDFELPPTPEEEVASGELELF